MSKTHSPPVESPPQAPAEAVAPPPPKRSFAPHKPMLEEFMAGNAALKNGLAAHSACLLGAHALSIAVAPEGKEFAEPLSAPAARAFADALYRFQPQAWGACARSDVMSFLLMFEAAKLPHGDWKAYQKLTSDLMEVLFPQPSYDPVKIAAASQVLGA